MRPLVSCIMPTYNRRRFVPQAIQYFLRQDYETRELIIIDDGTDPVSDLCAVDKRIRYVRLEEKWTVGAKRNRACELARGDIFVHWDDDDWMADGRLSYQVGELGQADICGLNRVLFFDPVAGAAWEYIFPGTLKPWVHGATLCYTKSFWEANPFPNIDVGEDLRFIWNDPAAKIVPLANREFIIGLIHPGNASPKRTDDDCWFKLSLSRIKALIGKDWEFYADPPASGHGGSSHGPAAG
ncbi:MAG: glycosyltransferase family 2 protein [Desulfobacterales bacterium]|nr:glycosyltransferase family 2 protein [Desulfobacterales bacterium]